MTVTLRIFFIGGITAYRGLINWLSPWIFLPTLVIARIEYPRLDPEPYLAKLDSMGEAARRAIEHAG